MSKRELYRNPADENPIKLKKVPKEPLEFAFPITTSSPVISSIGKFLFQLYLVATAALLLPLSLRFGATIIGLLVAYGDRRYVMRANHFFYLITTIGLVLTTQASAIETRYVTLSANLDERTATVGALPPVDATFDELAAGSQFQASVAVIDATKTRHVLRVYFYHTSSAGGPYSDWLFQIYADGSEVGGEAGAPVQLAFGPIVFDANRKQVETDSEVPFFVLWATGASPTPITPILTQFTNHDSESVLKRASQDGCIDRCSRGSGQDFDGDGIDDVYIWRPSLGLWAIRKSSTDGTEMLFKQWGLPGDYPMAGDYTGDRLADRQAC